MDWPEALELLIPTRREKYRARCADDHPNHRLWRRRVIEEATGNAPTPTEYPSLFRQAANLAGAVGRVVAAAVQGEPIRVPEAVRLERLAICEACDLYDAVKKRCTRCGCTGAKLHLATEGRPLNPPRWEAIHDGREASA